MAARPVSAVATTQVGRYTVEELRANRRQHNELVLGAVREMDFAEDIWSATMKDVTFGAMCAPVPLDDVKLDAVSLTRRLPVREFRASGWRTRIVDHETESSVNEATVARSKIQNDSLDVLVAILTRFMAGGVEPSQWKRDVSRAYRRIPIAHAHLDLSWVVWKFMGHLWAAQHLAMPFGTVSAVQAWHRVGAFMLTVMRRLFMVPAGRYVDDYFGASRCGVLMAGGQILTVLAALLGFDCDAAKDADAKVQMDVLGARVSVQMSNMAVETLIDDTKAEHWTTELADIVETGICEMGHAAKMAGRLSYAISVAGDRCGRVYLKPFHAQSHDPYPGGRISTRLQQAANWFIIYLGRRRPALRFVITETRQHVRTWSDAAGASQWVAAVLQVGPLWYWTRIQTPDWLWQQLLTREDHQIGFQELLGVLLAMATFMPWLQGKLWTAYLDNDGVLAALVNGAGGGPEVHMAIGHFWLLMAKMQVGFYGARVESKANLADGPTRDSFEDLGKLGAVFVEPLLPEWLQDMWRPWTYDDNCQL